MSMVTAEAIWDGDVPRLEDPRRYRDETKRQKWPVGTRLLIKLSRPTRSQRANAYYYGVVLATIEKLSESGNTADDLHDAFCAKFILSERRQVAFYSKLTGEVEEIEIDTRRSSALTGGAFYDYVEQVREFARVFWGVETPDPDPQYWRNKRGRSQ